MKKAVKKPTISPNYLHHFRLFFQHNSKTKEKFYLFRITSRQFHIIMSYLGLFSFLSFQKLTCIKRHHDYRWTIIYTIFWHSGRNESLDQIVNLSWKNIMFSEILNNDVPIKKVISVFFSSWFYWICSSFKSQFHFSWQNWHSNSSLTTVPRSYPISCKI